MQAYSTVRSAIASFLQERGLEWPNKAVIEPSKDPGHGDFATNIAMMLAKPLGRAPRDVAQELSGHVLKTCPEIIKADIAGPGFLNLTFSPAFWQAVVTDVEKQGMDYGSSDTGKGRKTMVEYVSANPTGPLHVGHGRGAAAGDSLTRLLRKAGFDVTTEYLSLIHI